MVVPGVRAITSPDVAFTDATEVLLLLQVPPASPLLVYVADWPIQSGEVPLTVPALAFRFTVNVFEEEAGLPQPLFIV